jgi:excinuclease ABC subunit A
VAGRPLEQIVERIDFLLAVGLGYLSLDRSAATLSGGESQRIRLATQIGSRLRGVLYVLDEPSIGLHARDNDRLLHSLEQLRNLGNTVLVVEHDEDTIRRADYVVDLGPGAGKAGGHLVAVGKPCCRFQESHRAIARWNCAHAGTGEAPYSKWQSDSDSRRARQ